MTMDLKILLRTLAATRGNLAAAKKEIKALTDKLENSDDYKSWAMFLEQAKATEKLTIEEIKVAVEEQYKAEKNKHPISKVEIKIIPTARIIDPAALLEFMQRNAPIHTKKVVDEAAAIDMAKKGLIPDPIINIEDKPQVQIGSNLDEYLIDPS
jgi:uncharacterized radical SAM superfamily Fe-S cluster-containing enzyme